MKIAKGCGNDKCSLSTICKTFEDSKELKIKSVHYPVMIGKVLSCKYFVKIG
jgi:hypothetical protein